MHVVRVRLEPFVLDKWVPECDAEEHKYPKEYQDGSPAESSVHSLTLGNAMTMKALGRYLSVLDAYLALRASANRMTRYQKMLDHARKIIHPAFTWAHSSASSPS